MFQFIIFLFIAVYCCSVLFGILSPLLSADIISGWDFTPQYYLVSVMKDYLSEGRYHGYDMNWFAGYPAFRFYGPLPYIVVSWLTEALLLRGYIELDALAFAFNHVVFALPFILLLGLLFVSRVYFGRGYGAATLFVALIALTQAGKEHTAPFHLYSTLLHGHFASFFAFVLFVYFLGFYKLQCLTRSHFFRSISIFLISSIILSHVVTSLFVAIFLLSLFFFAGTPHRKETTIVALFSAAITSFWWIPFLQGLSFTSGEQIGIFGFDPLQVFLPGIDTLRWCLGDPEFATLFALPYGGCLFFISLVFGLKRLIQSGRYLLPMVFLGFLLFLPRNFFSEYFYLPIHYYRFLMPLFAFAIPVAAYGLYHLYERLSPVSYARSFVQLGMFLFLFLTAFTTAILDYGYPARSLHPARHAYMAVKTACPSRRFPKPLESARTKRHYNHAQATLRFFAEHTPDGRVAIEAYEHRGNQLGSPHYFATMLPLLHDIEVAPGLLAESSLSSSFLIPTLSYGSSSLLWGRKTLYDRDSRAYFDPQFVFEDLIVRLREYRVQYILAISEQYTELLEELNGQIVSKVFSAGPYSVFEIHHKKAIASRSAYKPFLYLERGGVSFRDFSEEWFKDDRFFSYPVIFSSRDYDQLSQYDKDHIGGVILSYPDEPGKRIHQHEEAEIESYQKPVIVLNRRRVNERMQHATFIPRFGKEYVKPTNKDLDLVRRVIERAAGDIPKWSPLELEREDPELLRFQSEQGVLLRRSYAPGWSGEAGSVFLATPSFLYVIPRGLTVLQYR